MIDPPPETIDQVPPVGFPDKVLVSFSVIEAVDVVFVVVMLEFKQFKTDLNSAIEK